MSFDECTHLGNQQRNQDIGHFLQPQDLLMTTCSQFVSLTPNPWQQLVCFL